MNKTNSYDKTQIRIKYFIDLMDLVKQIETSDKYLMDHSKRVAKYANIIGKEMNFYDIKLLKEASLLHDIGKIKLPTELLDKPGRLSKIEYRKVQSHTYLGGEVLDEYTGFKDIKNIVVCHHEKVSGKGYPLGLKNTEIPLASQIISVADIFDALTYERVYKKALSFEQAVFLLKKGSGKDHREDVIDAFLRVIPELKIALNKLSSNKLS